MAGRVSLGRTDEHYVCESCDKWDVMTFLVDAREYRQSDDGGLLVPTNADPAGLDPPHLPPVYRCRSCGHEHEHEPPQKS